MRQSASRQLKNSGEPVSAKGMYGWELQRSQVLFEAGKIIQAEEVLTELLNDQPRGSLE